MKAAIFSFVRVSENSMVASVRIARYVSSELGFPAYYDEQIETCGPLDLLVIVNGAFGFCKHLPSLAKAVLAARRVVWIQNDYTIVPPKIESRGVSPFRAAFRERHEAGLPHMDFWTTCEDWTKKTPSSKYVNWNALTFDETVTEKQIATRRENHAKNLFYYGSYRDGGGKSSRVPLFDRYFKSPAVDTLISSPARQFRERYTDERVQHVDAIREDFAAFLGRQGLGLYIEDRMSSERFHSPANRFYEMLSAGLPMVFQPECGTMLRRAGFNPEPYVVRNAREVAGALERSEEILALQRAEWVSDPSSYQKTLRRQLGEAFELQRMALA